MGWSRRSQSLVARDITTELLVPAESGQLLLVRAGSMVTLTAQRLVLADSYSVIRIIDGLPTGFRPLSRQETSTVGGVGESTSGILQADTSGLVWMHKVVGGESARATLAYPTRDAWPTTFPGVSA